MLTEAQKKTRAKEQARLQALLASGVQIAGLEEGGAKKAKPVYDNRKKKKGSEKPKAEQDAEDAAKAAEKKAEEERIATEKAAKEEEERKTKEEEGKSYVLSLQKIANKHWLQRLQRHRRRRKSLRRTLSKTGSKPLMMKARSRSHGWMILMKWKPSLSRNPKL